jgi:hypothetical protein
MILSMYGKLSNEICSNKDELYRYLIEHSMGRLTNEKQFQIDYGNERLKIWM